MSRELSSSDKALLEEEGVSLPQHHHRKRKSKHIDGEQSSSRKPGGTTVLGNTTSEKQWEEVKQYLDPNPQLKGVDKGRHATKVSR